jgi:FtsZ-binding cell division protein ZapB
MTDKEIIKALECCVINGNCNGCPHYKNGKPSHECLETACKDALDLINRQQAENKELKTENLILSQKRFNIFERIEFTDKLKKQAKSEAIKEFADKMKGVIPEIDDTYIERIVEDYIDNLVKEMVGEDK